MSIKETEYLTPQEVADRLRVTTMTVYRLIKSKEIPAVRIGKQFRMTVPDVDAFIASRVA